MKIVGSLQKYPEIKKAFTSDWDFVKKDYIWQLVNDIKALQI